MFKRLRSIENKSGIPAEFFPQLPYYERDVDRIKYRGDSDKKDDDDDDDDSDIKPNKLYKQLENLKKEFKEKDHLEKSVDEEFNRIVRASLNLEGKKYALKDNKNLFYTTYNNNILNFIDDYLNYKIDYRGILDKKKLVDNAVEFYEQNNISQNPNIQSRVINKKKISKALQEVITLIDEGKLLHGDSFINATPDLADLSWMSDPIKYDHANNEAYSRYQADEDSFELLSIQTFLDNINRGYIKNREDARKEFNTVKQNVNSESLREIVKDLEQAIFGYDDQDDDGKDKEDKDWDNYQESIGERVKLKSQDKISNDEEF